VVSGPVAGEAGVTEPVVGETVVQDPVVPPPVASKPARLAAASVFGGPAADLDRVLVGEAAHGGTGASAARTAPAAGSVTLPGLRIIRILDWGCGKILPVLHQLRVEASLSASASSVSVR